MNELKIIVGGPWNNTCLGKQEAINLFKNIPNDVDKIIFDFGNIIYVGCLFVKEYLLLKESCDTEITEINIWESVQENFNIVDYFGLNIKDDELIQKFIDYDFKSTQKHSDLTEVEKQI